MANEQDEYDSQEEGEYHFSDEQLTEDVVEPIAGSSAAKPDFKNALLAKMGNMRRAIIGSLGIFILIFLVYKMLMPAAPKAPVTEITQTKPMSSAMPADAKNLPAGPTTTPPPQPPVSVSSEPAQTMPTAPENTITPAGPPAAPMMQVQVPAGQVPPQGMPPIPAQTGVSKEVMDKLAALEQNMQVAAASEAEYSQKMASYEERSTALQSKVNDLTTRLSNIEASLNQLTQLLKEGTGQRPMPAAPLGAKAPEAKVNYTVQAIIPGRAWLKSEAGETVTVAEGDALKDIGRIAKIDPYDGIVEVDTGTRIVTLTYGGGSEQ